MKKHFSYKSKYQIWRILISDNDKLIMELRDVIRKEVYYSCYSLSAGKKIFESLQLDEKYWIGIEALYKDTIFFHKFAKPDMPGHKEIIAFDITEQIVRWKNKELSYLFAYDDKVYCFKQNFESREFVLLNYLNGEIVESIGDNFEKINKLRVESSLRTDNNDYLFPEKYYQTNANQQINSAIGNKITNIDIVGDVEYTSSGNLLFFNYFSKNPVGVLINNFYAFNLEKEKILLSEILGTNLNAFVPDSFFVYKNYLFLLKEKNGLLIYKLE